MHLVGINLAELRFLTVVWAYLANTINKAVARKKMPGRGANLLIISVYITTFYSVARLPICLVIANLVRVLGGGLIRIVL